MIGIFCKLTGNIPRLEFLNSYHIKDMETLNKILEGGPVSFFNIRHPFERLVSRYLDAQKHDQDLGPFEKFITEEVLMRANSSKNKMALSEMEPHTRPFNSYCAFCNINYSVVSKMETFNEDKSRIMEILGQENEQEKRIRVSGGDGIQDWTKILFKNITENDKIALVDLYKYDFMMFHYDPYLY